MPDLGDVLVAALARLNDVLVAFVLDAEGTDTDLPAALADGRALAAFERIWTRVRPTQRRIGAPRSVGCAEVRLTPVTVSVEDLDVLGAAAAAVAAGVARHDPAIENVLLEFVRSDDAAAETTADVADEVARLHRLLESAGNDDAQLVHTRLAAADAGDGVLTPAEAAAYQRTVDRITAMWSLGSDILT